MNGIAFIAWTRFQQRSELLAQQLEATMHFIYQGQHGNLLQLPLRYFRQLVQTWRVFRREKPSIVFVQNPPIFCVLIAFVYAAINRAKYVIDSHTGAFFGFWRWFNWLHRLLSRGALTTIVHNESQERIVKRWGCRSIVLGDFPGERPAGEPFPLEGIFNVGVVSSFSSDEPIAVVFEAASQLPTIQFYMTGDFRRMSPALLTKKPDNCRLAGYLRYGLYLGLLRGVDVMLVLTTRNHTLLSGAYEAVSLGIPLITSDWPVLRHRFPIGTLHVPNTPEGICRGVRRAQAEHDILKRDILRLRERLQGEWEVRFSELRCMIVEGIGGTAFEKGQCPTGLAPEMLIKLNR